jgi:Zn-dependent protease with chaperone function
LALLGRVILWRLQRWARRGDEQSLKLWHGRLIRTYGYLGLVAYGVFLLESRWCDFVEALRLTSGLDVSDVWLLRQALMVLPFLLILLVLWLCGHAASAVVRRGSGDGGEVPTPPALTFRSYLVFQARQNLLVLLVPYLIIFAARDIAYFLCYAVYSEETAALAGEVAIRATIVAIYIFSPLILRLVWPTQAFPPGALRERLEAAVRRARVHIRDIILWRTGGLMINACMTGLGRPLRYVFLSDSLVEGLHPAQVEAVFGHELGHARYRHIPFMMLMVVAVLLALQLIEMFFTLAPWEFEPWEVMVAGVVFLLVYWAGFFGYVSRRFERQSDLFGARLTACPGEHDPLACPNHRPGVSADPDLICPYKAWAMGSALERTAILNGMPLEARSWRHFGIGIRIRFLSTLVGRPDLVRRYNRRLRIFKLAFIAVVLALAAITIYLSWNDIREIARAILM